MEATETTEAAAKGGSGRGRGAPGPRSPDFNGDGHEDLAISSALESVGSVAQAGSVHVLYGTAMGVTGYGSQLLTQADLGIAGDPEASDAFGWSLATGDYDGEGHGAEGHLGRCHRDREPIVQPGQPRRRGRSRARRRLRGSPQRPAPGGALTQPSCPIPEKPGPPPPQGAADQVAFTAPGGDRGIRCCDPAGT
jgi:hypothetical protein